MMARKYWNLLFYVFLFSKTCYGNEVTYISPDQTKDIGEEVTFNCTVKNPGEFYVSWVKMISGVSSMISLRDSLVAPDARFGLSYDKDTSTYSLRIKNLTSQDAGDYECQLLITLSERKSSIVKLQVRLPPTITNKTMASHSVIEKSEINLSCSADGFPRPTISWKRENSKILPSGGSSFIGNNLHIVDVHKEDRGNYYCVAENGVGTEDVKMILLEVEFAPQIKARRPKVAQAIDFEIELICRVEAYPPPAISWIRNDKQLNNNEEYQISHLATVNEVTESTLKLTRVEKHHYGDYWCKASNKVGNAETRINLFEPLIPVYPWRSQ